MSEASGSCDEWCEVCKPRDNTHATGACFDISGYNGDLDVAALKTFESGSVVCVDTLPEQIDDDATDGCPDGMFLAEYFANTEWEGEPHMSRCELMPQVEWGHRGPKWDPPVYSEKYDEHTGEMKEDRERMKHDHFTVKWTGNIEFEEGYYQFSSSRYTLVGHDLCRVDFSFFAPLC